MTEVKTCWTCKFREYECSIPPCSECCDLFHDFYEYTKWEPRKEIIIIRHKTETINVPELIKRKKND